MSAWRCHNPSLISSLVTSAGFASTDGAVLCSLSDDALVKAAMDGRSVRVGKHSISVGDIVGKLAVVPVPVDPSEDSVAVSPAIHLHRSSQDQCWERGVV